MTYSTSPGFAEDADARDPLKRFRDQFRVPVKNGREQIYFLGNSLGLQPRSTASAISEVLDQWAHLGVEGFFMGSKPWLDLHDSLTRPLSRIVGALPHEVVVMNQLTVNLHLMLVSFYKPSGKRKKILCEKKAFPSDQYMLETHIRFHGLDPSEILIEVSPAEGGFDITTEQILSAIDRNSDELALVLWGGVNYYTGQVFDMQAIAHAAHNAGAMVGYDLAHAAGNVVVKLHDWNVDFACWCSYKYLNSGPGSIGGAFIHERYHADPSLNRFAGWWGYDKQTRFEMRQGFQPMQSAEGWQLSTPSIILYAAHKAALDIFDAAGMENLAVKGAQLSDYLIYLLSAAEPSCESTTSSESDHRGPGLSNKLTVITPADKGCQVSILIKENGRSLFDQLAGHGIFADWREPDVIRVAPVPLYNTFSEVYAFVQSLHKLLYK